MSAGYSGTPLAKKCALVAAIVIAAAAARFMLAEDDAGMLETQRRGITVVAAIEAYRARAGRYPATLEDLDTPIQPPSWGERRWRYRYYRARSTPDRPTDEFELKACADERCYPFVSFSSRAGTWVLDS